MSFCFGGMLRGATTTKPPSYCRAGWHCAASGKILKQMIMIYPTASRFLLLALNGCRKPPARSWLSA
jgi:hypothetical protein